MEDQQEQSSGDSAHAVVVDIPSLAQALEQERAVWRQHHGGGSQSCTLSIGKVPELTRNVDEHEYNPQYVSIGPYHRNGTPNIDRDEIKVACLDTILSVAGTTVEECLRELARIEGDARSFYAQRFDHMTSLDFLRMLLLDACYVLNLFGGDVVQRENGSPVANGFVQGRAHHDSSTASAAGRGNKMEAVGVSVLRDVFYLAENQIPYLVVDKIDNLTFSGGGVPAVNAIAGYISRILQKQQYSVVDVTPPSEPGNLLHLVHMHFPKPTGTNVPNPATGGKTVRRCRTAMEYYIHGVNFKNRLVGVGKKEAHCILDVMFDRGTGTLVLPCLNIDAETWRILRNLMALEQQNPAVGSHVTAYCVFMSQLACTAKDVELLSKRGVIVHLLGNNEEVAKLFSDLCKGVVFDADDGDRNYLRATCQALDELYHSWPRRWMALLVHKYSANPWLAVGLMAAALGLVCTMVQAVYAVLSYHQGAAK